MRRWVIMLALMLMMPWAVSLVWMRSAGMEAKAEQGELFDQTGYGEAEQAGQAGDRVKAGGEKPDDGKKPDGEKPDGAKADGIRAAGAYGELDEADGNEGNGKNENGEDANGYLEASGVSIKRKILVERKGIKTYIDLEDYLPGVIACQIDTDYNMEALKCQAVIARTYVYRLMDGRTEVYEEELDMDYLGEGEKSLTRDRMKAVDSLKRCREAVGATCGVVMKYEDRYILPLFHAMSAGRTREGEADFPYLHSVESVWDTKRDDYMQVMEWSQDSFAAAISQIPGASGVDVKQIQTIKKDEAGYMVEMKIGAGSYSGDDIQYALGLPSPCFGVETEGNAIRVRVRGKGHGYGLSQAGADAMAESGWGYEDILNYYYKNISLISE